MWNSVPISSYDRLSQSIYEGYIKSDVVYSIVSKKAQAGARAPFGVYRVKSNGKLKQYKEYLAQKSIKPDMLIALKEDAIEPVGHYLNDKYAAPNEGMSGSEYTEALLIYLNLTGNTFEYALREGNRKDVLQFHPMPADLLQIKVDGNFPISVSGYQLSIGTIKSFDKEEIIHTKYFNPRWSYDGAHLYGLSPIQAAWNIVKGDDEGFNALAEQKKNRGPRILVGVQSDAISNYAEGMEAMQGMQDEFDRRSRKYQDRMMPVFGKLDVHDIGLSAKDMELLATSQMTWDRLCNIWHVPVEWFNTDKESKYNNLEQYNKQAIINGVMPDLNKIRDSRNRWARANGVIKPNEIIDYDPTVFTELDIDKAELMGWLKDSPFTPNEMRSFLGENPLNIEGMDMVHIPRNRVAVDKINEITNEKATGQEDNESGSGGAQEGAAEAN